MAKTIAKKNSKPGAWIVSSKDKGRKSIKGGKTFLNNNEEFEIELFNPLTVSVLADIKLNNQSISKTGLVLKPGQRVYLDCFIDDRKKFVFKTYEVEDTDEVSEAIKNNGLLEVFFYKEDVVTIDNWRSKFNSIIIERYYPYYYPYYPHPYQQIYGTTTGTLTLNGLNSTTTTNGVVGTSFTTNSNNYYSSSVDIQNLSNELSLGQKSMNVSESIETGRVEKGSKSKQRFSEIDIKFESYYISSTIIQILPESRKPAEIKRVKKPKVKKGSGDVIELIKKLSDLHQSGILTDSEFNEKKSELLSKI